MAKFTPKDPGLYKELSNEKITTPVFRVSHPKVFVPEQVLGSGDPKYQVQMLFDENDSELERLEDQLIAVAEAAFGLGADDLPGFDWPLRNGTDEKPGKKEYEGKIFAPARKNPSWGPVEVVHMDQSPIVNQAEFYAGCFARASVSVYAWTFGNSRFGVSISLNHIMKVKEGEPLTGGTTAAEDFKDFASAPSPRSNLRSTRRSATAAGTPLVDL